MTKVSKQQPSCSGNSRLLKHAPILSLFEEQLITVATAAGTMGSGGPGNERHGMASGRDAAAKGSGSQVEC